MKTYLYYPGCSLTGTAREYDLSVRAVAKGLGLELVEIDDWTCCGATAAQAVDTALALALSARNLALAGKIGSRNPDGSPLDILVPCSACYLNLQTAREDMETDKAARETVNRVLAEEDLKADTSLRVRHLLDVLARDVDWDGRSDDLFHPEMPVSLEGIVAAPYYGCQCLRPFRIFDDPENPHAMDAMIRATGARVLPWDMGGECCGASHGTTKPGAGRCLSGRILSAARDAHCILTVCPMCQMNLETCQDRDHPIPVLYLPQFLGMAMGIPGEALGLGLNLTQPLELGG